MRPGIHAVRKISSTRVFARVAPRVVPAVDRAVHRLTRGRVLLSAQLLPGLLLTSRGARTGLARRTPLACIPEQAAGTWILVGSNFGRPGHPAWTGNLLAHPEAEISWRGADVPVRAELLTGEERATAWEAALAFWPPYAAYQARVEREIRLFRLTRLTSAPD
ncbi:nitroreductase family deazaflavin-dependent oxidoreductase [Streptomyces spongiicola]|uniref:Nitroreductase family deazaflavin-dependent oxidoreductase n=1 Tax=Streptomyces spongiicola TaxID=1690221 RepID=A0A2S1Z194_9ACTN|nr:nitroreductase family deazaflavin-dependent oxidoreductase [Streptomyces spongiicola]AWK09688.1 nitroreductase family deazaflavin-dependent oxidoreductase [Streptomyces spongiicola]GBQ04094.1 nitroreductase family deazaflavin-dependent oxidoreductase [Streptomyces spongiicola]